MILKLPTLNRVKILQEAKSNGIDAKYVSNNTYNFTCDINPNKVKTFKAIHNLKTVIK